MKKSEDVQVVLKQEIALVDDPANSVKTVEISVKNLNRSQRTAFRLALAGGTLAIGGGIALLVGSLAITLTPHTIVISVGAIVGVVALYLLGWFIEEICGDYVLKKVLKLLGK